jgi:hypothetical protein
MMLYNVILHIYVCMYVYMYVCMTKYFDKLYVNIYAIRTTQIFTITFLNIVKGLD